MRLAIKNLGLAAFFMWLLLSSGVAFSHGVVHRALSGGVGLEALYDDGSPLSHSEVKVYAPSNSEAAFQEGLTDEQGRFMFYPTEPGTWKIEVDDGMGHGLVEEIEVGDDLLAPPDEGAVFLPTWQKALIGVSLIWGITGTWFWMVARRRDGGGTDERIEDKG